MAKSGKRRNGANRKLQKRNGKENFPTAAPTVKAQKRKSQQPAYQAVHYDFVDLVKSPLDPHHYQLVRLSNKLRSCIISTLDHTHLDYTLNSKTFCFDEVQDFNDNFAQLGKFFGPDEDYKSLLAVVTDYPWRTSIDDQVDSDPTYDNGSTSWERMSKYRKMDLRPSSLPAPQCCGISITVGAGSLLDPPQFPGMAHLCEHCVFEGTKKYANAWSILEENCLYVNAFTGKERTVYYARVDNMDKLVLVMSVFADMMIAPLLSDEIIQREIISVDSETSMRQSNDVIRLHDLFTYLARDGHPLNRYHAGDTSTLDQPGILQALRKWHKKYYHAANMIVSIQGPLPVRVLVRLVARYFGQMKPLIMKDEISSMGFPFRPDKFCKVYKVYPYDELQWLVITWSMPGEYWQNHTTKPLDYISSLLRHRGPGSIHRYLWNKGYITNSACCSTGANYSYVRSKLYSSIAILFELTDVGFQNCFELIIAVYSYLKMLKKSGPKRRIFEEMRQLYADNFHYKSDATCDFRSIGEAIHIVEESPSAALTSASLVTKYDGNLIRNAVNWIATQTMNIMVVSREFQEDAIEKHPNILTEFGAFNFNSELMSEADTTADVFGHFDLPKANRFISPDSCRPLLYHIGKMETDMCVSYLHTSGKAALVSNHESTPMGFPPTAWYTFLFYSDHCPGGSARNAVMANLWSDILNEKLRLKLYDALAANFNFGTTASENGLFVYVHGLSRYLPEIWLEILREITEFSFEESRFEDFKAFHTQTYGNSARDSLALAYDLVSYITSTRHTILTDLRHVLKTQVQYKDFLNFVTSFKSRMWICAQMFGSISSSYVKAVASSIASLKYEALGPHDFCKNYTYVLPQGEKCLRVKSCSGRCYTSVIINCYQAGNLLAEEVRLCKLLTRVLSGHLFRELRYKFINCPSINFNSNLCFGIRTEQQLGYLVWTMFDESYGVSSIKVIIQFQADRFTSAYVDEQIDESLVSFYEKHMNTDHGVLELLQHSAFQSGHEKVMDPDLKAGQGDSAKQSKNKKESQHVTLALDPSQLRLFYRRFFPTERQNLGKKSTIPMYRKLSVQVVGSCQYEKSIPLEGQSEGLKRRLCEKPNETETVNNDKILPVYAGLTLDIPADVKHENAYFLTDWFQFKNSMLLYPNEAHSAKRGANDCSLDIS